MESFALNMKEPLDEKLLIEALKKAVFCFPLFGMRPVVGRDGYLYPEENHLPIEFITEIRRFGISAVRRQMGISSAISSFL